MPNQLRLNARARRLLHDSSDRCDELRIRSSINDGIAIIDFGVHVAGGLEAGLQLARICMSGLAKIELQVADTSIDTPRVFVATDHPLAACMLSQYAGWKIATDDYFAMGSGPMRAVAANEELFAEFSGKETADCAVGVLEAAAIPTDAALNAIKAGLPETSDIEIAVAPTASQAGTIQVVARSVETAMHKLHELGFPVESVVSGTGAAPLPPVAKDDLTGIGRTNDSILYGSTVNLWVDCEDSLVQQFGPLTPSNSSPAHGELFLNLFKAANHDFYAIDKALFSPAVVVFHNLKTGRSFRFGVTAPDLLHESFGF